VRRATLGAAVCALAVISGAAASAQTVPAPGPTATSLPEIGRTRSRGVCTTVRDSVAPMVLGLMKSDELVGAGHRAFLKMSDDTRRSGSEALDLDQLYLRKVTDAMAHNLIVIDKLLADEKRFPKKAVTDDERVAQLLKEQIAAAAAQQRKTLDLMNGALETEALGRMQNEIAGGALATSGGGDPAPKGALLPNPRGPDPAGSFIGVAGISMPSNTPALDARTLGKSKTAGHTIWDSLANAVAVQQHAIAAAEQKLSPTVVGISIACREELASPQPRASP
jgi:hypothetical protein